MERGVLGTIGINLINAQSMLCRNDQVATASCSVVERTILHLVIVRVMTRSPRICRPFLLRLLIYVGTPLQFR